MKKLIAILIVMIVLVGAVFAAGPTTEAQKADGDALVNILATVLETAPRFELEVKSGATAETGSDGIDAVEKNDTTADVSALSAAVVTALTSASGTDTATVVFAINQIADARTNANYKLTLTAGDLKLVKYSDGTTPAAALVANEYFTAKTKTLAVGSTPDANGKIMGKVLTNVEMASVVATDSTDILTVDYHGVVAASSTAKVELGTFTVEWDHNADAVSGEYQAEIKLTVEAQ